MVMLQRHLRRPSLDELNRAMQRAWGQRFDPLRFCAKVESPDRSVLKAFGERLKVEHCELPLNLKPYGHKLELPPWGFHRTCSTLEYEGKQVTDALERQKLYCLLGLICEELIHEETVGFFFPEERVFARNTIALQFELASGRPLDPVSLSKIAVRN